MTTAEAAAVIGGATVLVSPNTKDAYYFRPRGSGERANGLLIVPAVVEERLWDWMFCIILWEPNRTHHFRLSEGRA